MPAYPAMPQYSSVQPVRQGDKIKANIGARTVNALSFEALRRPKDIKEQFPGMEPRRLFKVVLRPLSGKRELKIPFQIEVAVVLQNLT
jgi:hypothetical protein